MVLVVDVIAFRPELCVSQIVCNINDVNTTCDITAAVILPEDESYEMSLSKILPALETARSFVMRENWLPRNVNLTFVGMDDRCSNVYSTFRALHAYSTCAHVFFGPACEYALGECCVFISPLNIGCHPHQNRLTTQYLICKTLSS
jgi:hypothetical protein